MTHPGDDVDCPRRDLVVTLLGDDPELPVTERAEAEEHLAGCSRCRESLDELRALSTSLRTMPREVPSDEARARNYAAILSALSAAPSAMRAGEASGTSPAGRLLRFPALGAAVAAAACVMIALTLAVDPSASERTASAPREPAQPSMRSADRIEAAPQAATETARSAPNEAANEAAKPAAESDDAPADLAGALPDRATPESARLRGMAERRLDEAKDLAERELGRPDAAGDEAFAAGRPSAPAAGRPASPTPPRAPPRPPAEAQPEPAPRPSPSAPVPTPAGTGQREEAAPVADAARPVVVAGWTIDDRVYAVRERDGVEQLVLLALSDLDTTAAPLGGDASPPSQAPAATGGAAPGAPPPAPPAAAPSDAPAREAVTLEAEGLRAATRAAASGQAVRGDPRAVRDLAAILRAEVARPRDAAWAGRLAALLAALERLEGERFALEGEESAELGLARDEAARATVRHEALLRTARARLRRLEAPETSR